MNTPPLIGLSGRRKVGKQIDGLPDNFSGVPVDLYLSDYAFGVTEAGGIPVHLPVEVDADALVERLDGLVLSGGADVDPAAYGEDTHAEVTTTEPERDRNEQELLQAALRRGIPVFGICRGLQIINVACGGTLHQHIPEHSRYDVAPHAAVHAVEFSEGSCLHRLYGSEQQVNSLHHQTIDTLGKGITVTARADDGVAEGIELGDNVIAVQWHPESMLGRPTDPGFAWLIEQASKASS